MGTGKFNAGGNPAMDHKSHPGGSRKTPSSLHTTEAGKSSGLMGSYAADFTLPFLPCGFSG